MGYAVYECATMRYRNNIVIRVKIKNECLMSVNKIVKINIPFRSSSKNLYSKIKLITIPLVRSQ